MEEILASIKRIIEDTDNVRRPAHGADDADAALDLDLPAAANDLDRADADGGDVSAFREELHDEPLPVTVPPRPAAQASTPPFAEFASPSVTRAVAQAADDAAAGAPAGRQAIISDQTGRQVAAAFGELNDAFAASRRRSFDEIAEEMMRPMLQEWMDNNLPLLVERLVREEIERVARGGVR